ncbi:MerR family transcriptional regulator [Streptomyces sp. 549]|uniref:MerR family transcriptional regulator n=1 Tax=Streptomyces sp. 549 TaxID=3049076 RepID=UPI0024C2154C|nr:MerR family transcriptional regulator [Streptomyces sp. 549]MDK1475418.1 MerR family transcriptional regulator [Streptomyces sp. 549]
MNDARDNDADAPGLTTGAVARRLGVAPTTLRSWDRRYGIGPAVRHDGRHRRWTPGDIAMLEHMCRLTGSGVPPAEAAHQARAGHTAADPDPDVTTSHPSSAPGTPGASRSSGASAPGPVADVPRPQPAHRPTGPTGLRPGGGPGGGTGGGTGGGPGHAAVGSAGAGRSGADGAGADQEGANQVGPGQVGPGQSGPGQVGADRPGGGLTGPGGSNALPLGSVRKECRGLANAAVRLDAPALDARLEAAVAEHGLIVAWDEVIMPALRAVGRKWATSGERYVEVEHLLSWHISSTLRRLSGSAAVRTDRAPVLLACVPGEMHSLPLEALAAGLARHSLPVRMFGAAVPAEALDEAVRRTGPTAVVLWSQSRTTADRTLARQIQATAWGVRGARQRPALLLAGPGWAGIGRVTGTVRPRSLAEALEALTAVARA